MRHRNKVQRLSRPKAHRKALVQSLVRSLIAYEKITTTLTKAKAAQRLTERLISRSRGDELSSRRYAYAHLGNHQAVKRLFEEIAPRFTDQTSGFTRIFMLGVRSGDGAQMAILELTRKAEARKQRTRRGKTEAAKPVPKQETGKKSKKKKGTKKKTE